MKKSIIKIAAVLFLGTLSFSLNSCSQSTEQTQKEIGELQYACPMDCEKGKTYLEEGICPICEMDLKEI